MAKKTALTDKLNAHNEDGDGAIRAISRGLSVLKVINRKRSANLTEISRETEIPYPTVCRIVTTLLQEEMIEREPNRKRYRPTAMVQSLAVGYQQESSLVTVARQTLEKICSELIWPISLATRVGSCMVLLDSTHHMTSLTLSHYYPGFTMPVTECATGRAYLAYCDKDAREQILNNLKTVEFTSHGRINPARYDEPFWQAIRDKGYAVQAHNLFSSDPGKTSSIAVPILINGTIAASIAVIFFRTSLSLDEAELSFVDKLTQAGRDISKKLEDMQSV